MRDKPTSISHNHRTQQDTFNEFVERFDDAIVIYGETGFVGCNDAAMRLLGYDQREQLFGAHPADISPPHQPDGQPSFEKAEAMIALAYQNGKHRFEWTHKNAAQVPIPVEVVLTPMMVDGKPQIHAVMRDISEHKALLDQLHQLQKLDAMGKLAGGIAHDFNNLLVVVMGHAELLQISLAEDEDNLRHANEIWRAGERAATVIKQLLAFGRKQPVTRRSLDLNEAINQSIVLLQPLLGDAVVLETNLAPGTLWIKADLSQLEQVLMNLASNASDAMPDGGKLTIRTSIERLPEPVARLTVSDTGVGMDADVLACAVEPFFTTKPVGKGTGLGLSSVYGIVTQNEGSLELDSSPEEGTTIIISFPICLPPDGHMAQVKPEGDANGAGTETILLVEDDEAVFTLTRSLLLDAGYQVIGAHDGAEAWALLQRGIRVQLVLSDVFMPNKTGPQLLAAMRTLPEMPPILFMSGYTGDQLRESQGLDNHPLLEKPFTAEELRRHVRQILDAGRGQADSDAGS
ncbi:MAG: ATP-binding protein [Pseudomonadota bacterium]